MSLLELLSNRAWERLVMALLHTLWQGALVALVMSVVLRRMPARLSNGRYFVALAAQIAVLLAGLLTWSLLEDARTRTAVSTNENVVTVVLGPAAGSTSLFFNPAVWWIGRQVRLEREACCDAAVVRLTGRPLEYSR
jgi:hypothetical protein